MRLNRGVWNFLVLVLVPFKMLIAGWLLVGLFFAFSLSLNPYILKIITDKAVQAGPNTAQLADILFWPMMGYLGLGLMSNIVYRLYDYINLKMIPPLRKEIVCFVMDKILNTNSNFFVDNAAGAIVRRLNDINDGIEEVIQIMLDRFTSNALVLIVAICFLYSVHWLFSLIMLVWVCFITVLGYFISKKAHRLSHHISFLHSTLNGKIVNLISNIKAVRLFNNNQFENKNISTWTHEVMENELSLEYFLLKVWTLQGSIFLMIQCIFCFLLVYLNRVGISSAGDFFLVLQTTNNIMECLSNVSKNFTDFNEHLGKLTQGLSIVNYKGQDVPDTKELMISKAEIRFNDVTFYYNKSDPVFDKQNILIKGGQKIGVVGYSGSGKTTFINLILRIISPYSGKVLVDDQDIAGVTLSSLSKSICIIPQEPLLFNRTILENVIYGKLNASIEEVHHACEMACIHSFIMSLPLKYDTIVDERDSLSGGQRQRLVIARTMLRDAPILILDEATSSLDSLTEQTLQANFTEFMRDKTTIVIAHKLLYLNNLDRILVFDKGKIVQDGPHSELVAIPGLYRSLWYSQGHIDAKNNYSLHTANK